MTLVNTGVVLVVHVHQDSERCDGSDASHRNGRPNPAGHHDPAKCTFCIHLASGKAILPGFPEHINLTAVPAQQAALIRTFFRSAVFLPSSPPRAPPSVS